MAHRSGRRQPDVSDFARQVVRAVIKAAIRDDARAEPCAHGQEDHVFCSLARAKSVLRHRSGVGVILHLALTPNSFSMIALIGTLSQVGRLGGDWMIPGFDPGAAATDANPLDGGSIEPPLRQQLANPFLGKLESPVRSFAGSVANSVRPELRAAPRISRSLS